MRTAFIKQLVEEARKNSKIFLLVGDLGYNVVECFSDEFPDRFLNVGIAEQNMAGIAAGLSMTGYNVYIYSIGNFPTLRCMEQIRNDIVYHHANVKIVAVGAGYAYGSQGISHHATEDIGMLRTLPDMVVCSPGDPVEAKAVTSISANRQGPMYIRLGKAGEGVVHSEEIQELSIGDILPVKTACNSGKALLVSGSILNYAVNYVTTHKIVIDIYSLPFVKPLNIAQLMNLSREYSDITILEEHQKSCGIGSAVIEQINDLYANGEISVYPKIHRIGIDDKFYSISGSQDYLRKQAGLVFP